MADNQDKKLTEIAAGEFVDLLIAVQSKKMDDGLPTLPVIGSLGPWIRLVHTIGLPWAIIIGAAVFVIPALKDIHKATQEGSEEVRSAVREGATQRHQDISEIKDTQKEITRAVEDHLPPKDE